MNRQIALAYGIAGLAVATALVVVVGSTAGLFGGPAPAPPPPLTAQVAHAGTIAVLLGAVLQRLALAARAEPRSTGPVHQEDST